MRLELIPISKLNPAAYNPRKNLKPGDPEYEKIKRSIKEFGLVDPIVSNRRTGNVVGGHQRLKVLIELGHTHVWVSVVDLPLAREKALNIALNKVSGAWDQDKLAQLLDELTRTPDLDVTLTGFDTPDINELVASLHGDAPESFDLSAPIDRSKPAITKPGELLQLGVHRLICGDCTDAAVARRLMAGERAALFATDPPYLVNYNGLNHPSAKNRQRAKNKDWSAAYGVHWDEASGNPEVFDKFIGVAVAEAIDPRAAWYCWHASRRQAMLEAAWEKHGAFVHQQIIWAKDRPILTRSWYSWQHEPCFFGWLRKHKPRRCASDHPPSVWVVPTIAPGQVTEHPTVKPLELFEIPMRQHTRGGDICYEPFAGSGTQIIAAQRLGRRCFACEIDPYYCDVAVRRYLTSAGTKAPARLARHYARTAVSNARGSRRVRAA